MGTATRIYHITKADALDKMLDKLWFNNLSVTAIECYINWADNDCMKIKEIAEHLEISYQAVSHHLSRIGDVWPHLFDFGPSPNHRCVSLSAKHDSFVVEKF